MISQLGWQTVTIHISPNIYSRLILVDYDEGDIFLQKSCGEWGRETGPRSLFVFLKNLYVKWKQAWLASVYFNSI